MKYLNSRLKEVVISSKLNIIGTLTFIKKRKKPGLIHKLGFYENASSLINRNYTQSPEYGEMVTEAY